MKLKTLVQAIALIGFAAPAFAQEAKPLEKVEITGSSIKRIQVEGALPVQVISRAEIDRQGIVTAEQLIASLNSNGSGPDNLASNADVISGAKRGTNGASSANLRGQGADSTLVLLNGRRIATYGLNGQAVDLNSIPMAAVQRVEVLKDGASAIYGTDAIGGVINFILRSNFTGLEASAFNDMTEQGGGNIARVSVVGGTGDLEKDGKNLLFTFSRSENKALRGDQRSFVNTFQPNRGLSVDTRGTPYATVFATTVGASALSKTGTGPIQPGTTVAMNGINTLDLPGQAGCSSVPGQSAYDEVLWASPAAKWGCAWDTGRAAVLQQPVTNTNFVARALIKMDAHQITAEAVGSRVESQKSFSPNQISPSATNFPVSSWYPSTGSAYNSVFNSLVAVFPTIEANRGLPIAYRWRCMPCGNREIETSATSGRLLLAADGPLGSWDYKVGVSQAFSQAESKLGNGYFYRDAFISALGTGIINPFSADGKQTQAAMDLIANTSAKGVVLYGGKNTVTQLDSSASGELFKLPAGTAMGAVGFDLRKEEYTFNGDQRAATARPVVYNAPFDDANALAPVSRSIAALYAEVLLPIAKNFDVTVAARRDRYTGFGASTNPKVSFRYTPLDQVLLRGSYNTAFRVPNFNQLFYGVTESPYVGKDLVDPGKCATLKVDTTKAGCESITPNTLTGGKSTLQPETAKQSSIGIVIQPMKNFNASLDYWSITRENTIDSIPLSTLLANYALFKDNFIRDASGTLVQIDQRWVNAGGSLTRGLELNANGSGKLMSGAWAAGMDGSYLLEKKSRSLPGQPYGPSLVGVFSPVGDLGLRWKHTAYFNFKQGDWSTTLTQIYRAGYTDQVLPGVANGSVVPSNWKSDVDAYSTFNISTAYSGFKGFTVIAGIKNILNTDPPFAVTYDSNTGGGSSWEPRVADPRGRSYTMMVNYKFQ